MMMDGCPEGLFAKAKVLVVSLQAVQCGATGKNMPGKEKWVTNAGPLARPTIYVKTSIYPAENQIK